MRNHPSILLSSTERRVIFHMERRDGNGMVRARRRRRRTAGTRLAVAGAVAVGLLLMGARWVAEWPSGGFTPAVQEEAQPMSPAAVSPPASDPAADKPAADDWRLLLVNPWNPLPEGYEATLVKLKNGLFVDERCYPALQEMMDDCRAAGLSPVICSAYRSTDRQERLYNNQVDKLLALGYARAEAETEAAKAVAVPGTSEHQLGLAVDIVDLNNQNLDESQEETAVQKWLMDHSWEYGFILRYPGGKSETTGIIYEPWHYRYVGQAAAREIYTQGLCLEEYLEGETAR